MLTAFKKSTIWSTGLAMFSMFFGAGNIVFPLALGQLTQDQNLYAVLGLILTAILVPFIGLFGMMLFDGDYHAFFRKVGGFSGFCLILLILCVIGSFGGIPRCINISYSTLEVFGIDKIPMMNLTLFSLLSCGIIFLFTRRPNRVLTLLGYGLTPLLLLSLGLIFFKGIFLSEPHTFHSTLPKWEVFSRGFVTGYSTMDLLGAFFFSSGILLCLREKKDAHDLRPFVVALFGGIIAAFLLALVYVGFTYLAGRNSALLANTPSHQLLGTLAFHHLGSYAGILAGLTVTFACLTTEIALALISAQFIQKSLCKEKISYTFALIIVLVLSFLFSTLQFDGISTFLAPILEICYPSLIVLTLSNIAHKVWNFQPVKLFFWASFLVSLGSYLYLHLF